MPSTATFVDWQLKVLSRVSSTQDIVKLAAKDGDPEGYIVQAMMQADGKGRHGNVCLLYTSPSPRDLSTSRMPSSA